MCTRFNKYYATENKGNSFKLKKIALIVFILISLE